MPVLYSMGPRKNRFPAWGVEAPGWQGARRAQTGSYSTDEERRETGWIGGPNGKFFLRGPYDCALGWVIALAFQEAEGPERDRSPNEFRPPLDHGTTSQGPTGFFVGRVQSGW